MQIVETTNEGLKRAYTLTIAAKDIDAKIEAEVKRVAPQVKMPGFRPGKVPANLVRKMHGEALHADVLNNAVRESVDNLMKEKALRPALQPSVTMAEGYEQGKNAELTVELEVLPEIAAPAIDGLKLEKLVVPVSDAQLDEALQRIAGNQKSYKDAPKTKKAAEGDQIIIDFVGSVDGVEFEGGKAEDAPLVLGSGQFIPGFEDQLTGVKTGDEKTITVTFPEDYPAENLKGKEAQFAITVKQVKVEGETKIDEDFAKSLGLESLDKLKELMKGQLEQESAGLTRTQMKRQLLDTLAADHDFPVPPSMVEAEFAQIWQQLQNEAAREEDPEAAKAEIEAEKDDYKRIAERRVRLGLLLSEIGQANGVEISGQEMQMLIQQAAQQYRPEDRQRFVDYVRAEPMVQAQLRAPLYEEKVVDFLFDKAEVSEREVTREELEAAIEAEESNAAKPAAKKPAAKKAPAKKAAKAETAEEAPAAEEAAPARKAPAKKPAAKKAEDAAEDKPAKAPAKKPAAKKPAKGE
jgi:trigger factor